MWLYAGEHIPSYEQQGPQRKVNKIKFSHIILVLFFMLLFNLVLSQTDFDTVLIFIQWLYL